MDYLRKELFRQRADADLKDEAASVTMADITSTSPFADITRLSVLHPFDVVAAFLGINPRSKWTRMSNAKDYGSHVRDETARQCLAKLVQQVTFLRHKLGDKVCVADALAFADELGWTVPVALQPTSGTATTPASNNKEAPQWDTGAPAVQAGIRRYSANGTRDRHPLAPVLRQVMQAIAERRGDQFSVAEVMVELQALARQDERPAPLNHATQEGVTYFDGSVEQDYTRRQLRGFLDSKRNTANKAHGAAR